MRSLVRRISFYVLRCGLPSRSIFFYHAWFQEIPRWL